MIKKVLTNFIMMLILCTSLCSCTAKKSDINLDDPKQKKVETQQSKDAESKPYVIGGCATESNGKQFIKVTKDLKNAEANIDVKYSGKKKYSFKLLDSDNNEVIKEEASKNEEKIYKISGKKGTWTFVTNVEDGELIYNVSISKN